MERTPHWIPDNKGASIPQRVVVIDVQPQVMVDNMVRTHIWRCGSCVFIHWSRSGTRVVETRHYTEIRALWNDVVEYARPRQRTVVYFHNLPYRVRLADGLSAMASARFQPVRMRLSSRGAWASWRLDKTSILFADIASLLAAGQDTMSTILGQPIPSITDDSSCAQWTARSVALARMWGTFVAEYFEWLRTGECGNWQVTGAGQAWAHWRHSHYTHRVLVHSDADALAAEREAMFAGRAEMYWWGKDVSMPAYEWDWQSAYLRIARDFELPTELVSRVNKLSIADYRKLTQKYAVLAKVHVETEVPVAPTRMDGKILWPVGEYSTCLWNPEISALLDVHAKVQIETAWLYRKAPVLHQWADKMLRAALIPATSQQQWKKYVAKHWGRALVGRFAARYQNWEEVCNLPWDDVNIGTWVDVDSGDVCDTAQIGRTLYRSDGYAEAAHSAPQITSYVMSQARVKLWDAMNAIGLDAVVYVNTDSLVVTSVGHLRLQQIISTGHLDGLILKQRCRGVEIYGHQTAVLGATTKLAGCPSGARRTTENTWVGECWSTLDHAVTTGELDRVTVTRRQYTARYSDTRRKRVAAHATRPWRVRPVDERVVVAD